MALPRYRCQVLSVSGRPFRTESGLRMCPDAALEDASGIDTLIIAGGSGLRAPATSDRLADWLRTRAKRIRRIAAVCTGIYGLASAGLLDGRRVTTHWRYAADVARRFPRLRVEPDRIFIADGRYFTSAGVTAAIDLALALVEADHGPRLAVEVARELVVYLKRNGGQEQYSGPLRLQARSGDRLAELTAWIAANLAAPLTVEVLAARANLSARQLQRRFVEDFGLTPAAVVERVRLDTARERLSEGNYPIERVARMVGFRSADVFRRAFARRFGTRPSDYRGRFAGSSRSDRHARRGASTE